MPRIHRVSGTIRVKGGTVKTTGQDSPGIYSTGDMSVSGAEVTSTDSEVAVIEGSNSIKLRDCSLTSSVGDKWSVMLYQSMSGDAEATPAAYPARASPTSTVKVTPSTTTALPAPALGLDIHAGERWNAVAAVGTVNRDREWHWCRGKNGGSLGDRSNQQV